MELNAKTLPRIAAGALTLLRGCAAAAPPLSVYRCGPDGRVYSQTPWQDGQPVSVEDSRSAAQQRAAKAAAERPARTPDRPWRASPKSSPPSARIPPEAPPRTICVHPAPDDPQWGRLRGLERNSSTA
jgi:hypothetical protein